MPVWPLPRITFQALSAVEESRPIALLTNEDTWAVLGSELNLPIFIQAEPPRNDRELFDYLADNVPSRVEAIYVVGQGAPLHAGKIIAARQKRPLVIIPTALDSDEALTPVAWAEKRSTGSAAWRNRNRPGYRNRDRLGRAARCARRAPRRRDRGRAFGRDWPARLAAGRAEGQDPREQRFAP